MERYESYKDSGVEWIGEIPREWGVNRVGNVFTQRNETVSDKDYPALSVTKRGVVPQLENVAKTSHNDNRKLVLKGDFVINSRSDRKGSSGTSEFDGSVSVINMILRPRGIHGKYSHYLFRSYEFVEEFFRFGKGIVWDLWSTRFSEMKGITIPVPSPCEQEQIVEFLDRKTTLIDSLIEKTEKRIELLKEKRTSLINQVVTKGLNPDVEMKDSGVEWIGDIPGHWSVAKLKFIIQSLESGTSVNSDGRPVENESEIGVLKTGCVSTGVFVSTENKKVSEFDLSRVSCPVEKDVVIVNRANSPELVGSCGYVSEDYPNLYLSDKLWKTVLNRAEMVVPLWLSYVLGSEYFLQEVSSVSTGTSPSMKNVSKEDYLNLSIPRCSYVEQEGIVHHLNEQTSTIDSTITTEEKRIELLKEYRQSLISEVVTGKVKV